MKVTKRVHNELSNIRKEKAQKKIEEKANFIVRKKTKSGVSKQIYGMAKTKKEAVEIFNRLQDLNPDSAFLIETTQEEKEGGF